MSEDKEKFLSRWSRLKQDVKEQEAQQPAHPPDASNAPPPDLPPVEKLTFESDFRGFFHPKVDEKLRRAALKKLFSDPHFNVMDGLDVYIDDYSKPSPLPAAMLAQLRQAQKILDWAKEIKEEKEEHPAEPPTGVASSCDWRHARHEHGEGVDGGGARQSPTRVRGFRPNAARVVAGSMTAAPRSARTAPVTSSTAITECSRPSTAKPRAPTAATSRRSEARSQIQLLAR